MDVKPSLDTADVVALVFALTAALVVIVGTVGVLLRDGDPEPVFQTAELMVAGTFGYLAGGRRNPRSD